MTVALLTGTHEFDFVLLTLLTKLNLSSSEITKYGEMSLPAQQAFQFLSYSDAAAHDYDINVVRRTFKEDVAHIATHHVALDTHRVGYMADLVEDFLIQNPGQCGI